MSFYNHPFVAQQEADLLAQYAELERQYEEADARGDDVTCERLGDRLAKLELRIGGLDAIDADPAAYGYWAASSTVEVGA